ncbi:MAG: hypothetical protein DIU69_01850 [Bacillota bacterium]|nr:MAG: hypothetical protein DIU69_01850 [Bacillota bacterium]
MPRRRTNSVKLTIRLSPEDVARLDDLCLPDEPRSTAAARLLQRVLRQPDPLQEMLDAIRRIERRLSSWQPATAQTSEKAEKANEETAPTEDEQQQPRTEDPTEKPKEPDKPTKPDLGLAGILEGFDLH